MASAEAPVYRRQPLKVGCVQFDPKLGDVAGNTEKVRKMTARIAPKWLNILVLPEMALTGYIFPSLPAITPYLEHPRLGPTALLCRELATRLGCYVVGGYPEIGGFEEEEGGVGAGPEGDEGDEDEEMGGGEEEALPSGSGAVEGSAGEEGNGKAYNSAVLVSPSGEIVGNYRKTFLFETDKNWATEGDGFKVFDLPQPLGRVALGICMDMNPKDFLAPFNAYELSTFVRSHSADMLIVPMNWLNPPPSPDDPPPTQAELDDDRPEESTLNYWAHRLTPLHDPAPDFDGAVGAGKEVVFVACNRVGVEKGTTFVGTSCVMTVSANPARIELIECLGRKEEEVLVALVQ